MLAAETGAQGGAGIRVSVAQDIIPTPPGTMPCSAYGFTVGWSARQQQLTAPSHQYGNEQKDRLELSPVVSTASLLRGMECFSPEISMNFCLKSR